MQPALARCPHPLPNVTQAVGSGPVGLAVMYRGVVKHPGVSRQSELWPAEDVDGIPEPAAGMATCCTTTLPPSYLHFTRILPCQVCLPSAALEQGDVFVLLR